LVKINGSRWVKVEDGVRVEPMTSDNAKSQLGTFVNNTNTNTINNKEVEERQALSKVLKPKADN